MPNSKWKLIVSRRVVPFRAFIMAQGSSAAMQAYIGLPVSCLVATKNELSKYYMKLDDLKSVSQIVIKKIKGDSKFPQKHVEDCLEQSHKFVEVSGECGRMGQMTSDASQLSDIFTKYCATYRDFVTFVLIPVAIEQHLTANITSFLAERINQNEVDIWLNKLMTPPRLAEVNQEQEDLVTLALLAKWQGEKSVGPELQKHIERYQWLSCYNIDEAPFDSSYFSSRLMELLKLDESELTTQLSIAQTQHQKDNEIYHKTIEELNPPDELRGQIEILRQYAWLRTYRIEMQSKANFNIRPLFESIASFGNQSLRTMAALSPKEIISLLGGKVVPSAGELEKRIRNYLLLNDGGNIQLYLNDDTEPIFQRELGNDTEEQPTVAKGVTAYPGKISGVVRVVLKKEQLSEFLSNEVLVTTMTSPEMVPAMRRASAIVTNEGGVLCHAAIVAREFKIPCVIGTQRATEIFHNGDKVEVDADNGVIRIL